MELPKDVLNERARIKCERERVQTQLDRLFDRRKELEERDMKLAEELYDWVREVEDLHHAEEKARVPTTTEGSSSSAVSCTIEKLTGPESGKR